MEKTFMLIWKILLSSFKNCMFSGSLKYCIWYIHTENQSQEKFKKLTNSRVDILKVLPKNLTNHSNFSNRLFRHGWPYIECISLIKWVIIKLKKGFGAKFQLFQKLLPGDSFLVFKAMWHIYGVHHFVKHPATTSHVLSDLSECWFNHWTSQTC